MKAFVTTFVVRTGAGVQTITGVVDKDGSPFTGTLFWFMGNSTANTLGTWMRVGHGIDDLTQHFGQALDEGNTAGIKNVNQTEAKDYSIAASSASIFFGGNINRLGHVSASRSGEFDVTIDLDNGYYSGDSYIVAVFGGADLSTIVANVNTMGAGYSPGFQPQGALFLSNIVSSNSSGISAPQGFGFADAAGHQNATSIFVGQSTVNNRILVTDKSIDYIVGSAVQGSATTSNWTSTSVDVTRVSTPPYLGVVFGGPTIRCVTGTFVQRTTNGATVITPGITPKFIAFASVGQTAGAVLDTTTAVWSVGAHAKGSGQAGIWGGESLVGNGTPTGARYLNTTKPLAFYSIAAGSSTRLSAATVSMDATSVTVTWSETDSIAREIAYFIIGEAIVPPVNGSIVVTKQVEAGSAPSVPTFNFTAGGGLSPTTFTLADGESQAFPSVVPGSGYSIEEAHNDHWFTTYEVSNSSSPSNIIVAEDEDVTILVTNTFLPHTDSWRLYRFDIKARPEQRA